MKNFMFISLNDIEQMINKGAYVVILSNIKNKSELMESLQENLLFPEGFGKNWDALNDSLAYLDEFVNNKEIIVIHKDLPQLNNNDFKLYIEVLIDSINEWAKWGKLKFDVIFPEESKCYIEGIVKDYYTRTELRLRNK